MCEASEPYLDIDSPLRVLLQVKLLFYVIAQQVADLFIVNLKVGGMHQVLHVLA